jgi:hypothetical protein
MRSLLLGVLSGAAAAALLALLPARAAAQEPGGDPGGAFTGDPARTPAPPGALRQDRHEELHEALHEALRRAERAHLLRVGAWGVSSAVVGTALALSSGGRDDDPFLHGLGVQTAGWGLVNTAIAAGGLAFGGRGDPPETPGEALAAESRWGQILVVNLGLNAGYMMAGGALVWAGGQGIDRGDELRGHATAVIAQGFGLLVLDGLAWLGHRGRMQGFADLLDGTRAGVWPDGNGGFGLAFRVPGPRLGPAPPIP